MVLVPALLMVSTIRFRSVKAIDVGWRRSYLALFLAAVVISLIAIYPRLALVVMAYSYVAFALLFWILGRLRRHHDEPAPPATEPR
jgi:phosphatidylserine synthase